MSDRLTNAAMLKHMFKPPPTIRLPGEDAQREEQSLLAETLLRACAYLLERTEPVVGIEYMCKAITEAAPHICLVWAWFGASDTDVIEPQVVVGSAGEYATNLRIKRNFLTELGPAYRVLGGEPARAFDVSTMSPFAPWRELARQFGVRSALVVPISSGGDERGLLALYSSRPGYFNGVGIGLFEVLGQLFHAILKQSRRRVEFESSQTDVITGLSTRRHAERLISEAWQMPLENTNRGVLFMIDVDDFKSINDTFGHQAGDAALGHIATLLKGTIRKTDVLARWGGDEFLAWLPALDESSAMTVAEKFRASVAVHPLTILRDAQVGLRISVGAAGVPATEPFRSALDRADRALMRAKQKGRNCVVVAVPH